MTIKKTLFVFMFALFIRLTYAWFFIDLDSLVLEDQMMYIQLGKILANTGYFLQDTGNGFIPVTERLPGYPALLSLIYTVFGQENIAVVLVQIVIDSLTCVVIALIAEIVVPSGFIIAGIVAALNLNMVILSGMILTDTLFLFLFSLFILLVFYYIKNPSSLKLILLSFVLCTSILVRPVSYYLVFLLLLLLIVFFIWKKVAFKKIIYSLFLYIIPFVIIFGPIHHKNYHEYSTLSLTSQGGGHALNWIVPAVYQYSGQGSYQEGKLFAKAKLEDKILLDGFQKSANNPFTNSSYKMQVAKEALTDLGLFNVLHAWSVGIAVNLLTPSIANAPVVRTMEHPSFYATSGNGIIDKLINYVTNTNGLVYLLIITIGTIISFLFLIMSIFGFYRMLVLSRYGNNREIIIFSLFIVSYFLSITGPIIGVKYRLPIEPIMILYVTYAVNYYLNKKDNISGA